MQPQLQTSGFVARHRFVFLFITLVAFFLLVPILHEVRLALDLVALPMIEPILFVGLIGGVVVSLTSSPHAKRAALGLGLPTALLTIAHGIYESTALGIFRHLFGVLFLSYAIAVMLRFIFSSQRVNFNTIAASLCIYLLLGIIWAVIYSSIDALNPHAFKFTGDTGAPATSLQIGTGAATSVLYYSFTTLTTLGYGDIVPISPMARALATIEAVTGQLYLAVLVSRLVGLHIADSINQDRP